MTQIDPIMSPMQKTVTRNLLNNELSVDANASLRICVNAAVGDITLDL